MRPSKLRLPRQHGDDREVLRADDVGDLLRQRAGVADAGRAAVADEVEAERLQRLDQLRPLVVLHDDLRARGERGLHPRLDRQAALDGVLGQQAGADHHGRVGGVRARGDRGDHDVAVVELGLRAVGERDLRDRLDRGRRPARPRCPRPAPRARGSDRGGACRWWRARRRRGTTPGWTRPRRFVLLASGRKPSSAIRNDALDSVSETRSCGRFGPGQRRHDLAEVELERLGVGRLLGVLVVPQALLARVGLDELDALLGAPGELEVAQRLGVDREDRAGRAELRRHVADRRAVGQRQVRDAGAVELDELGDHAVLAQHLRDGEHEVGRGGALGQVAVQLEADDARDQHRHRLAEHRGLGLDAADAPAEHAEAVDHRRVRVGADERVGIGLHRTVVRGLVAREDDAREVLEVDLVDDAGVRRDDLEVLEGGLAPAQERVALLVALELLLGVDAEGVARAELVDLHGVVDDELDRHERVDLRPGRRRGRPSRRASRRGRRRRGRP